ncbi:hypothetical protein ACHWQZ_G015540 [Mnemiopsis leidyi]
MLSGQYQQGTTEWVYRKASAKSLGQEKLKTSELSLLPLAGNCARLHQSDWREATHEIRSFRSTRDLRYLRH